MRTSAWLLLVAACAILAGLIFGFSPVKSDGYSCGSAFHERKGLAVDELSDTMLGGTGANGCDTARSGRQAPAWALLGIGVVVGLAGVSLTGQTRTNETAPPSRS